MLTFTWPFPAPWGPREVAFDALLLLGASALLWFSKYMRRIRDEQATKVWFPPRLPQDDEQGAALPQLGLPGQAPDAEQCFLLAEQMRRRGAWQQAETFYRTCLTLAPTHQLAQSRLAGVLLECGRAAEAVITYQGLVHAHPDDADAHYNLGHAYFQLRLYAQTLTAWRQAAKLAPTRPDVKANLKLLRRLLDAEVARRRARVPTAG